MTTGRLDQPTAHHEDADEAISDDLGGRRELPLADREQQVLDRIERARNRRPRIKEERITMSHGAGGKATQTLIEAVFLEAFRNPLLEPLEDAAQLHFNGSRVAMTTDSYVVSPLFFPGGNIGDLAVNGTVNDLSVAGAVPLPRAPPRRPSPPRRALRPGPAAARSCRARRRSAAAAAPALLKPIRFTNAQ